MSHVDGRGLTRPEVREADVVVVGSGPAGSAAAAVLAAAGARVIVVESGPWLHPEDFRASGFHAMATGYRGLGATIALGRAPVPIVQGRLVGGSSPINGAICWRLPRDVYDGWVADDPALAEALPWAEIEAATDAVEARWNVRPTAPEVAGRKNELMARGAEALGLAHRPIRRNVTGCAGLGRCAQGCPRGAKGSADRTHLADALDHGATVISSTEVTRVVVTGGRAVGVEARSASGAPVRLHARHAVVLAASAVQSPALLLRSGLSHGPVGHGFQGHPGVAVSGRFAEPVRAWEGATQGHEVTGLRHEGLKFEVLGYDVSIVASRLGGFGTPFAHAVADAAHHATFGAAVRSTARGRVRVLLGRTVITWSASEADLARFRRGIRVMGELLFAAGAESVSPAVRGFAPTVHDPAALAAIETHGPRRAGAYRSVMTHLFGTCRLGSDPARAVVRPDLRHHAVAGLHVVDSSVFPTNTGVNPQVSIAAIATLGARRVLTT